MLPISLLLAAAALPDFYGETYYAELPALYQRLYETEGKKLILIGDAPFAGVPELRIFVPSEAYHLYRDGDGCEVNPWTAYLDRIYEYG